MSDETYYTVLNVKETASLFEIKTAYRALIKQVHPDTITTLAPYLRRIAEDKAKEIIEAYGVLSNSSKRRDYDRQLAEYRPQTVPQAPPAPQPTPSQTASTAPFGYCNKCGTSLHASGYCPKCSKFATSAGTPAANPPRPQAVHWLGYNWSPLMRWSREHPFIVVFAVLFSVVFIASLFPDANTSQSAANTSQSAESKPPSFTNNAAAASTGPYSKYPCDFRDKISPIDGKPCSERQDQSVSAPPQGLTVDEKTTETQSRTPTVSVSSAHVGTVHVPPGYEVVPPAANLKVETHNAPAVGSKLPAETREGPKQPDLSSLTSSERQSIEAACSHAKYIEGPAAYDRCLLRQFEVWTVGPKEPDLSSLTSSERQSIQAACSHAKYIEGPLGYDRCLIQQLEALTDYRR